jgi:molybdenum cofactor cytidylyltransferase
VLGVPPDLIDELAALDVADAIIVEADGARERPFKAPAAHEPVLPSSTTVLVPVMGARALDAPLDAEHVHRPELVARLAGARLGESITPVLAARVLAHPEGGLKGKPEAARAVVLVNQVQTAQEYESARTLARLLLAYDVISAVAIGAVGTPTPVQEAHRRVAAIILAAGASTRMEGRVKQLLPWRGKTLVENAIEVAVRSSANQVVSVLGAHADQVRVRIQGTPARVIINPVWEEGQASSVRAGLAALSASVDAAIFMNTDQPFLTTGILDAVIHRYWVTDAAIVASRFAGQRGSPVLFNRGHWPELMALQGEQGGRVLLDRYPEQVEWVDFPDARAGIDVDTYAEYESLLRSEN